MSSAEQCCYSRTAEKTCDVFQHCCSETTTNQTFSESYCCSETTTLFSSCFRWNAALTTQKKTDMLWHNFFLKKLQTDLSNIKNFEYEQAVESLSWVIKNDILNIMNKQKKFNVSDINKIFNAFLKIIRKSFTKIIATLIQTCWQLVYYFKHFYRIRTVALCKVKKNFYTNSHFWRLITLLNIVEKIIKIITVKQIQKMIEKHNMLSAY